MENIFTFLKSINLLLTLLYTILGALGSFIGWFVFTYNSLVQKRRKVDEMWANIGVALKKRVDLIPNLLETVKGYAAHERETFEKVTQARSAVISAKTPAEEMKAENMLTQALKSLFAISENYPDLKASANFLELQREISGVESDLQQARGAYNNAAQDFNVKIESLPSNFVAKVFRFKQVEFFKTAEGDKEVPKIKF